MLLHGIIPPVTTPFHPDGSVYHKKLEHNVERYSKTPVSGILVLGSTGEAIMLSDDERREVLRTAREACAAHKVLIAGTGAESAFETIRLTEYAAELGYDAALVRTPHFYRPQMQAANLLAFYRTIADRSPVPVLIYSVPVYTKYDIPAELVIELSRHPNIIGIKESGGDAAKIRQMAEATRHVNRSATVTETFAAVTPRMLRVRRSDSINGNGDLVPAAALAGESNVHVGAAAGEQHSPSSSSSSAAQVAGNPKTRQKEVGFQILAGAAQRLLPSLEAGAVGAVLAFADPAPTACYEIYAAWKEGDQELARLKQDRISGAAARLGGEFGIPALKYAMDLNGYYGGQARLPFLPLTAEPRSEVERLMADIPN